MKRSGPLRVPAFSVALSPGSQARCIEAGLLSECEPSDNRDAQGQRSDAAQGSEGGAALPPAERTTADERQAQLPTIASDLLSWKGWLNVLRQAQLPKWRGHFQWQIEAKIEALQAAYARLRAEAAKPDG